MRLAIIGSALNGGAAQVIEILEEKKDITRISIYDDNEKTWGKEVLGVDIVGGFQRFLEDKIEGSVNAAVIAVGSVRPRKELFDKVRRTGVSMPNIISDYSIISRHCRIGRGNIVMPRVYIGPGVVIGDNNYFTSGTTINHDTTIGTGNYFSTCVATAGRVRIGSWNRMDTSCCILADAIIGDWEHVKPNTTNGPDRGI